MTRAAHAARHQALREGRLVHCADGLLVRRGGSLSAAPPPTVAERILAGRRVRLPLAGGGVAREVARLMTAGPIPAVVRRGVALGAACAEL